MSTSEEAFLEELRKTFAIEAEEYLQTLASGLVEIEKRKDPAQSQSVTESVYRAAHSLKGAARSVNQPVIGAICQSAESVFSAMKKGLLTPAPEDYDILQHAVDEMGRILAAPSGGQNADEGALIGELDRIAARGKSGAPSAAPPPAESPAARGSVREAAQPPPAAPEAGPAPGRTPSPDTIRIETAKIDALLLRAEELITIKLAAEQRIAELTDILGVLGAWRKEWAKAGAKAPAAGRQPGPRTQGAGGLFVGWEPSPRPGPLNRGGGRLHELDLRLRNLLAALRNDRRSTGLLVDHLLEGAKTALMLPFATLLQTFPKMVRDISREMGKEVEIVFTGGEIEIDKRMLERMKDPLIHLLRNAIDHGLENPDVRRANGKASCGRIAVDISQAEGNRIQIRVADDGAGIDTARLRAAAAERGVLSSEAAAALDDEAALMLIFQSGLSTSPLITDLSGRGLGLAIVQEAVDKLDGRLAVETAKGVGTTFRISLPLTLATFHGMLLQECGQAFVVPTASVERALRVKREDVRTVENRATLRVDGAPLPLVRLGAALGLAPVAEEGEDRPLLTVVVLVVGQKRMAFSVDHLLHEQEILIKGLGKQLVRVRNIAGATVLGSGKVVPVLNVADLLKSGVLVAQRGAAAPAAPAKPPKKSVLVVEDSITSRLLLRNILASAGYDVQAVVDGLEAWTAVKARGFDAVVSDIEMPRMNGFDLTAKIRADAKLADLPVVLVTARETPADRARGIEVGADAYLVKSSFDQSNLLDVVRRLL